MISFSNYTLINPGKNNDISLYLGLFEKSPTVLREAIFTTPYSGRNKTVARPNCSPQEKNSKIDKRWVCLFWTLEYVYLAI